MSGTKVYGVTRDWQTEELAKGFPYLCRSKLVLCEDVDAVLRKLQPVYQELLAKYSKAIQPRMVQDALTSLLRLSLPQEVGQRWTLEAVGDMVVKVVEHHRQMAATMEQGSDGLQPMQTEGNSAEGSNLVSCADIWFDQCARHFSVSHERGSEGCDWQVCLGVLG